MIESPKLIQQKIQVWGTGLGVRITAPVAKAARMSKGVPVSVESSKMSCCFASSANPSSRWHKNEKHSTQSYTVAKRCHIGQLAKKFF